MMALRWHVMVPGERRMMALRQIMVDVFETVRIDIDPYLEVDE